MLRDLRTEVLGKPTRFAVLLNARAKRWTGELHEAVSRWVPAKDLFLTEDFHQARHTVDRLLSQNDYDVIFTGGGDGTIVYLVNEVEKRIADGRLTRATAPPIGVLRMGTGNALATYLERGQILDDLRALAGGAQVMLYHTPMITTKQGIVPFAGFGWDATILNDYDAFKASVRETALENVATGLRGYTASILTRSIPGAIVNTRKTARITTHAPAVRIHPKTGEVLDEYLAGDVIYEGVVDELAASTIAYWGFKVRMFPYCTLQPGMFEVRAYHGGLGKIIRSVPHRFWKGDFDEHELGNFLASDLECEILDGKMAYHVAGDPEGPQNHVRWTLTPQPIPLAVPVR